MLDTGIDVPEVVNLVFFKIVRSRTKFWQMIGRGTRLCEDLYGPGQHKTGFYLFDYCQNLEYFAQNPGVNNGGSAESLGSRLFKARVSLIAELDTKLGLGQAAAEASPPYAAQNNEQLRVATADLLRQTVAAMNVDNFVVRPQRRSVEKFAKAAAWKSLSADDQTELADNVASLPSEQLDDDEEAKRFDLLILRTQLSILQASPDFARLRDQVREIAGALELQEAIPAIKAEIVLIQAVSGEEWWTDVTLGMLENARKRLRALIKLIEKAARKVVYTDFVDELGTEATVVLPEIANGLDMAKFKDKARQFLKAHEDHLALQRLKRSQPLTPTDLTELEQMLVQAGGTPEMISKVSAGSASLGIFIRSLVGMDRDAVYQAFNEFVSGTKATPDQLEFIDLIVAELTANGVVEARRLYESPYLDISPQGPEALFPSAKVDRMFEILEDFKRRAA
jgi:type I restriction enzyme R subunit